MTDQPAAAVEHDLTGDDDSVAHSFDTERVAVYVDVDRGIAPLVRALNAFDFVRTYSSCAGHPHSEHETRAYVGFSSASTTFDERLAASGVPHEILDGCLYVDPSDVERLAKLLRLDEP